MNRKLLKNRIDFEFNDGGRLIAFPESVKIQKRIGDCVIRAIAIATEQDYDIIWNRLFFLAKEIGFFPNNDNVCAKYLFDNGWEVIKMKGLVRMNDPLVTDLAKDKYIICYTRKHWVAMKNNIIYDTFNSSTNSENNYQRVFRVYTKKL